MSREPTLEDIITALLHATVGFTTPEMDAAKTRTEQIQAMWNYCAEGVADAEMGTEDGLVLMTGDPWNVAASIDFMHVTYGDKRVIEAEGVVVHRFGA